MKIVKAEILWSRRCPLQCDYCAMATGIKNSLPTWAWKQGMRELKKLGCEFAAFYGAEPLVEFNKLPDIVGFTESIGINTTIITSGCVPSFHEKLRILYNNGARSISMSHDMVPIGSDSERKMSRTVESLQYFQSLGSNVRDVAAIATLTRENFQELPDFIRRMTSRGIWVFFDFIHPYRHQPGAKTRSNTRTDQLIFRCIDYPALQEILEEVLDLKNRGYLCHSSRPFLDIVSRHDFSILKNMSWNCALEENFPAWLTIDCDGTVHACDDFQLSHRFKITDISQTFEDFSKEHQELVTAHCPGCCWNTHIDAHLVKAGRLSINDYVHGLEKK